MSMFDPLGPAKEKAGRSENTRRKLRRLNQTLRHEEPDRVPISDFFWGSFVDRWRRELGLPADANPCSHYDLDWVVTVPNMDPWIRPFETLREDAEGVVVKTGFGAVMHKHFRFPMPEMRSWETDTFEKLEDDGRLYLFSYFEYVGADFSADMARMAADPATQKWWAVCKPCQEPLASRSPEEWWAGMEEVFHTHIPHKAHSIL